MTNVPVSRINIPYFLYSFCGLAILNLISIFDHPVNGDSSMEAIKDPALENREHWLKEEIC